MNSVCKRERERERKKIMKWEIKKEGRKEGKEVITKNKCSKSVGEIINVPEEYGYGMERHKA